MRMRSKVKATLMGPGVNEPTKPYNLKIIGLTDGIVGDTDGRGHVCDCLRDGGAAVG